MPLLLLLTACGPIDIYLADEDSGTTSGGGSPADTDTGGGGGDDTGTGDWPVTGAWGVRNALTTGASGDALFYADVIPGGGHELLVIRTQDAEGGVPIVDVYADPRDTAISSTPATAAGAAQPSGAAQSLADLDGDGILDLAVQGADGVVVLYANGEGGWRAESVAIGGDSPTGLFATDTNLDGQAELLTLSVTNGSTYVEGWSGTGTLTAWSSALQNGYAIAGTGFFQFPWNGSAGFNATWTSDWDSVYEGIGGLARYGDELRFSMPSVDDMGEFPSLCAFATDGGGHPYATLVNKGGSGVWVYTYQDRTRSHYLRVPEAGQTEGPVLGYDLDGDGATDAVDLFTRGDDAGGSQLSVVRHPGRPGDYDIGTEQVIPAALPPVGSGSHLATAGDADADGCGDLAFIGTDGAVYLLPGGCE